jgi:glutathione S-transferase
MSFKLYYHPLSSFCQKVTIAFYENDIPFDGDITDVVSPEGRAAFVEIWPIVKFPVLRDKSNGRIVPESSIIIEYVQNHARCKTELVPGEPDRAHEVRLWDRFFDLHVNTPMQKVMGDRRRPDGSHDPFGVTEARDAISTAYGVLDSALANRRWAAGDDFSMADCAAAPALFYARMVLPFSDHRRVAAYFDRLSQGRPVRGRGRKPSPICSWFPGNPGFFPPR